MRTSVGAPTSAHLSMLVSDIEYIEERVDAHERRRRLAISHAPTRAWSSSSHAAPVRAHPPQSPRWSLPMLFMASRAARARDARTPSWRRADRLARARRSDRHHACGELARAIGANVPVGLAPHGGLAHLARGADRPGEAA
jgi:hypothetical protein